MPTVTRIPRTFAAHHVRIDPNAAKILHVLMVARADKRDSNSGPDDEYDDDWPQRNPATPAVIV
jgi:hypothetical protein